VDIIVGDAYKLKDEETRQIRQHIILTGTFGGRLFFPPLNNPSRILDCGYGAGTWAVAMGELYEDSEVC
jgi:hypothetical protein